jgi:hypothetical protein
LTPSQRGFVNPFTQTRKRLRKFKSENAKTGSSLIACKENAIARHFGQGVRVVKRKPRPLTHDRGYQDAQDARIHLDLHDNLEPAAGLLAHQR